MRTPRWLIAVVGAILVLTMPLGMGRGDPHYWQAEAINFIVTHHLWLEDADLDRVIPGQYGMLNHTDGHYHAKTGVMNSILTIPPLLAEYVVTGELPWRRRSIRVALLDLYNVLFALAITAALYQLTRRYTDQPGLRIGYVMACVFATFLWHYLRIQGGEIYHVLAFTLLYAALLRWRDVINAHGGQLTRTVLRAGAVPWALVAVLCLLRLSYVLLAPVVILATVACLWRARDQRPDLRSVAVMAAPALGVAVLMLATNAWRYGSPLDTGYEDWQPEEHLQWRGPEGVIGFLIDPQFSVFIAFPVLIAAVFGFRRFARAHRFDAALLLGTFLVFLFGIGLRYIWRGGWCYGPRYLVFMLPVVALPALSFFEGMREWRSALARQLVQEVTVAVVIVSVFLQVQYNRLNFFTYYLLRDPPKPFMSQKDGWLLRAPLPLVNFDLLRKQDDLDSISYVRLLRDNGKSDAEVAKYKTELRQLATDLNYFWPIAGPREARTTPE
jgi:hypothetical protein